MRRISLIILGVLGVLLAHSLFGSISFIALAALYSFALYRLFFSQTTPSFSFLIGLTLALELLGASRFGAATLFALLVSESYFLFKERLRFTSLYTRYILALLLVLTLYNLIFFPISTYVRRSPALILTFLGIGLITFLSSSHHRHSSYELL